MILSPACLCTVVSVHVVGGGFVLYLLCSARLYFRVGLRLFFICFLYFFGGFCGWLSFCG